MSAPPATLPGMETTTLTPCAHCGRRRSARYLRRAPKGWIPVPLGYRPVALGASICIEHQVLDERPRPATPAELADAQARLDAATGRRAA